MKSGAGTTRRKYNIRI